MRIKGRMESIETRPKTDGSDYWTVTITHDGQTKSYSCFSKSISEALKKLKDPYDIEVEVEQRGEYWNLTKSYTPKAESTKKDAMEGFKRFEDLIKEAQTKFKHVSIYSEDLQPIIKQGVVAGEEQLIGWRVKGIVEVFQGDFTTPQRFTAYGFATADNVNPTMKHQLLHMADTRSKARALRVALGEKVTAEEMEQD